MKSSGASAFRDRLRLPRKKTSVAQFRRFLDANPDVKAQHAYANNPGQMAEVMQRFSPDPERPQIAVTYEAAQYCNWLSKERKGFRSEWVYPTDIDKAAYRCRRTICARSGSACPPKPSGSSPPGPAPLRRGFRRLGGSLGEYAWFSRNPPRKRDDPIDPNDPTRTRAVGTLKPNPLGLFDIYGNVWEWLHDRRQEFTPGDAIIEDREDAVLTVDDQHARTRRGGSFAYGAYVVRSAHRGDTTYFPQQRRDNVGFRVAHSLNSAPCLGSRSARRGRNRSGRRRS